jgi:hypothetical protein
MGEANEMSVRLDRVLLDQIAGRWQLLILDALLRSRAQGAIQCSKAGHRRHLSKDAYTVSAPTRAQWPCR